MDATLQVLDTLPENVIESEFFGIRYAWRKSDCQQWYFCPKCQGWVEGGWSTVRVNTLNSRRLSGKHGKHYLCSRCGQKLTFLGMVS